MGACVGAKSLQLWLTLCDPSPPGSSVDGILQARIWASQVVLVVKSPLASAGDVRDANSIPESGRSPGGGHSNPIPVFLSGEQHWVLMLNGNTYE